MTDKRRSENADRFAGAARKLKATLGIVGDMMDELHSRLSSMSSSRRIRNLGRWSVAEFFKPRGELHRCFLACHAAIGGAKVLDSRIRGEVRRKIDWFWKVLARHIDNEDVATDFLLLVERLVDLSEDACSPMADKTAVSEERRRLYEDAFDVFKNICKLAKTREMRLRHPGLSASADETARPDDMARIVELAEETNGLAQDTNAHVRRMDARHKRDVASRKASRADDAMERMRTCKPTRYKQIVAVAEILVGKDKNGNAKTSYHRRRNYFWAAKRLFDGYKDAKKDPPAGGYPTHGALFQFIHANKGDFYKLLESCAEANGVALPAA